MATKTIFKDIIMIVVSMIIFGSMFGLGLFWVGNIENQVVNGTAITAVVDPTVLELVSTLIPIVITIAIIMLYVKYIR